MAAIIAGIPGEDVDGISHGGRPVWFKNNNHAGCYFSVSKTPARLLPWGIFLFFFFFSPSDRLFPFFKRSICSGVPAATPRPRSFNANGFTVCGMWAILLGCLLREQHRNNGTGRQKQEEEKKKEEEGGEGAGGGSENSTFTGGPTAITQCWRKVYWMCLAINKQLIGT